MSWASRLELASSSRRGRQQLSQYQSQTLVGQLLFGDTVFGVERYVLALAQALANFNVQVIPICLQQGDVANRLSALGFSPCILPGGGYLNLPALNAMTGIIRETGLRILHAHLGLDSFLGALASMQTGVPLVLSVHFEDPAYMQRPFLTREPWRLMQILKNTQVKHFLPITEVVAEALSKRESVSRKKMTVIHPGILARDPLPEDRRNEIRQQMGITAEQQLIATVARLAPEKGIDTLLQAAARLKDELPNARFVIAGDGDLRQELESEIKRLQLGDTVKLLGYFREADDLSAASDLFVLPSKEEPFGIAAVEAMMAARPVVATSVGGLTEIVVDNETGRLVPAGDANSLAATINQVLTNTRLSDKMGQAGRKRAIELFTADRMAQQTLSVYKNCLESSRS